MSRILIKSKYHAEFKRYSITDDFNFTRFEKTVRDHHALDDIPFLIFYTDPLHGDLLPINNDENFAKAKSVQKSILKIVLQAKGESYSDLNDFNKKRNFLDNINNLLTNSTTKTPKLQISLMEDFHQVSSIIDTDVVPKECRRVRITKHGSDKPLGFYIRDGTSIRFTPEKAVKGPAIFISRVLPGGLAESTGLLAVNDEVLEVNGIDVLGKSIEQVTDMMVANASNLILTIKPASQSHPLNDSFISNRSSGKSLPTNSSLLQHQPQTPASYQRHRPSNVLQPNQNNNHQPTNKTHQEKVPNNAQPNAQQTNNNMHPSNLNNQNNVHADNVYQNNLYLNNVYQNIPQNNTHQSILYQTSSPSNQQPYNYPHQYSSLRPPNQKTVIQLQHNNSFNYPKSSLTNNNHPNYQQAQQQENQLLHSSNQFNSSSSRQNLDFHNNGYGKIGDNVSINNHVSNNFVSTTINHNVSTTSNHYVSSPNNLVSFSTFQPHKYQQQQQQQKANQHTNIYQNIRVNDNYRPSSMREENGGAVGASNYLSNLSNNDDIIERLRSGYFEVEESNDYEDEEEDEVIHHPTKNLDKLQLRNVYQNSNNNQGLNVN